MTTIPYQSVAQMTRDARELVVLDRDRGKPTKWRVRWYGDAEWQVWIRIGKDDCGPEVQS